MTTVNPQDILAKAAARQAKAPQQEAAPADDIDAALGTPEPAAAPAEPGRGQTAAFAVVDELPFYPLGSPQAEGGPAVEAAAAPAPAAPPAPKAVPVGAISDAEVLEGAGALALHEAIKVATGRRGASVFKVVALQSGYSAEMTALSFEDITRLQSASVDIYAQRIKLLRTVHAHATNLSCGALPFGDWLKLTSNSDLETLLYGLYAATYPGANEFDVACRHCGHGNKVTAEVAALARVTDEAVFSEIAKVLDPKTTGIIPLQNSVLSRRENFRLPDSGIVVTLGLTSIQDMLDNVQWFGQNVEQQTGALPDALAGSETLRALAQFSHKILVPRPGTDKFIPVTSMEDRLGVLRRLSQADGSALHDAADDLVKKFNVDYRLPDFNCAACTKKNSDLFLNFEALLFTKLRARA